MIVTIAALEAESAELRRLLHEATCQATAANLNVSILSRRLVQLECRMEYLTAELEQAAYGDHHEGDCWPSTDCPPIPRSAP